MSHPLNIEMGIAWDSHDTRVRSALCILGSVDSYYSSRVWCELSPQVREQLLTGLRAGIDLGVMCSRVVLTVV
jgi:hypothetical protein